MKRLGIALAAAAIALTTLCAGQTHASTPKWTYVPPPPLHHGDWGINAITAYDVPAATGSGIDLVFVEEFLEGPTFFLGGSPTDVDLFCTVFHNFNAASATPFSTITEGRVDADAFFTPPPTYDSGLGQLTGADVSPASKSVYSAAFVGGESPDFVSYGFPTFTFPGYVQGTLTSQGWNHFSNAPFPGSRYADSGTMTMSLRGVIETFPFAGPPTFASGAMQCQIGNQPVDTVGLSFATFGGLSAPYYDADVF